MLHKYLEKFRSITALSKIILVLGIVYLFTIFTIAIEYDFSSVPVLFIATLILMMPFWYAIKLIEKTTYKKLMFLALFLVIVPGKIIELAFFYEIKDGFILVYAWSLFMSVIFILGLLINLMGSLGKIFKRIF